MTLRLSVAFVLGVSTFARAQTDSSRSAPIAPLLRVPAGTWGASVTVIDSAEISTSTATTFSELLQARRPGVRVFRSGGLASDGSLVMLRGPTSLIGLNAPIIIVDGVRVDSRQFDQPIDIGSTAPSRLDDLSREDIERIEVLSGAAAALYGDGAASGVILVTTKSGGAGPLRFTGRFSWSAAQNNSEFPANYERVGTSPSTGQPAANCSLIAVAAGSCTPTALHVWNPLEQASPFRTGNTALGHVALGGIALGTSIFTGVSATGRQGVLPNDRVDRIDGRAKVTRALPGHFNIEATGASLGEHARSAVDGNTAAASNVLGNGLIGSAQDDANRGYLDYGTSGGADSVFPARRLRHTTGGVTLSWRPLTWLAASAMTGRDLVTERWHEDVLGPEPYPMDDHRIVERHDMRTSAASVTSIYPLGTAIAASTTTAIERDVLQTASFDSSGFPAGAFSFSYSQLRMRSTAFRVIESLHFPREIDANIAAERVTSSLFGADGGREWFPSANLVWSPMIDSHGVSDIRLRAAYTEAPGSSTALTSIRFVSEPFSSAPPRPTMERTSGIEISAEATIGHLTSVEATAFSDRSTRLWALNVPTTFGPNDSQIGTMTNRGIETIARTTLLDLPIVRWDGTLSLALYRNRVVGLSDAPPPIGSLQLPVSNGYALGGVWARTYTYADVNHDGIIATNEVQLGPFQYAGSPLPTLESAFASTFSLPGRVALSALLDYRRGNHAIDLTSKFRCQLSDCRETQDPTAPIDRQAAAVASRLDGFSVTGFVEGASFVRLREIGVRWTIPPAGSHYFGMDGDLTIAARNLATWTNYRGLDPEISYQAPDILPRQEFLIMPLPRELVVRLDVRP